MMTHTVLAGTASWLTTLLVPTLVDRFGDMRGVWIPAVVTGSDSMQRTSASGTTILHVVAAKVITLMSGVCCACIPPTHGYLIYVIWPLFGGPSFALNGFAPDLLAKLVPADVQGTFQTSKSFLYRLSQAIFMWPWNQLYMQTAYFPYPWDATALWVSVGFGVGMLLLTCYACRHDPCEAIKSGKALDAFMASNGLSGL